MKKQFKTVQILLAVAVFCLCVGKTDAFAATRLATADDIEYAPADMVLSVDIKGAVEAGANDDEYVSETMEYTFTLNNESYVCLKVDMIENAGIHDDGTPLHLSIWQGGNCIKSFEEVKIYSKDTYRSTVLKKGTYTVKFYGKGDFWCADTVKAKFTCKIGYIPVDEVIVVTPVFKKGKLNVSVNSNLMSHEKAIRYRKGAVDYKYKDSQRYWDKYAGTNLWPSTEATDGKCIVIKDGKIKVSKPGKYTINVIDKNDVTVSQIFDFTKFDKKKPVVKGVKNKKHIRRP